MTAWERAMGLIAELTSLDTGYDCCLTGESAINVIRTALADAERRAFRAALNKVTQDFVDNVYEIGGDIGTNEVLAFLESRIAHYPEAQATQEEE